MKPIGSRVLVVVTPVDTSERIDGGIITLAGSASAEELRIATVKEVGPECKQVVVGDEVALPKFLAHEFSIGGDNVALLHEDEILGIM
jgi:co-chaperonin GroES (HSP10)